ncbi:MAG: glycosyltransferase family 4 protein [Pyrinomonadaceae bacterium]|nr:glycosyltransferase family 4 protein [Pyrinomonadaceae bacterium]
MILSLQTTTFSAFGGIPTYNRLVCRVLNEFGKSQVLIATDKNSDIERPAAELPNLKLEAFAQNRLALTRRVVRLGLAREFDLVLIGHVNYAPLGWLLKKLQPRRRYGVMLYGIEAWQQLSPLRRRALQHADFMISISNYTRQKAIQANLLIADRVHLLPNALEAPKIEAIPASDQSPAIKGTRLLSVCRLDQNEQYKGVDKVIEVLQDVAGRVPDVQYVVVGSGTDLERHMQLAHKLGVAERVHFLGFLSDVALRASYQECDVFVMPSAGEGFGFVFLEAMQCGKPIIAANSGGAPEVVQDGVTGRLVEYGNKEQLATALIDLCLNPAKRDRLGQAGYQRLQENFTFPRFKQRLTEILLRELPTEAVSRISRAEGTPSCAS